MSNPTKKTPSVSELKKVFEAPKPENPKLASKPVGRKPRDPDTQYVFHMTERNGKRVPTRHITVCYTYDERTQTLTYGATVFRVTFDQKGHPTESWKKTRLGHIETAQSRFKEHPVVVKNFPAVDPKRKAQGEPENLAEFRRRIRKELFKNSVRSHPTQ